ncbi:MAG: LysR family transcriptional regulator [Paracoccaceae bacterium]
MESINYHHLRYFREVASEGHLGRTAERLNVSQSAISIQIKQLEDRIGQSLFDRVGRTLVLTEAGRIALDYADRIFTAGDELLSTLNETTAVSRPLRVGALSTLSRNFQLQFLRPLIESPTYGIALRSGNMASMIEDLTTQALDVVLATEIPHDQSGVAFAAQKISENTVGLHGQSKFLTHATLGDLLQAAPLILPSASVIRAEFENLVAKLEVQPQVVATVDDMAMVRLLAREGVGVALAPAVVLADEIANGSVVTAPFELGFAEPFYAITLPRRFPHPALSGLLDRRNEC